MDEDGGSARRKSSRVVVQASQTEPDLKRLFPKIVRLNEVSQLEMDVDRDMLQRHAVTVMEGLGAAVESLEDSDFLNSVLISIGQTHVRRSVKPQMLKVRASEADDCDLGKDEKR
ncbi:hypothetical protein C0Q70_13301 [Pomacea canaliculata]|uniref:Globin n=1 Tax=Pomacea canaliculata TaxID=400727 RepID=A0A2T7NWV5_POMCA|nr:hypothetical protein C0Q70_13301 [Pomacea canaliculata]